MRVEESGEGEGEGDGDEIEEDDVERGKGVVILGGSWCK